MKILIATPEAVPFAKTGGLADVTGALLKEYRGMRKKAYLILPLYKRIKERFKVKSTGMKIKVLSGDRHLTGSLFSYGGYAYFIECDEFFDREDLYGTSQGDYPDNASRFAFFSQGILEACKVLGFKPDVIHCNDWQTGLVPLYLKTTYRSDEFFCNTASLITIHNLGYQGLFPATEMPATGLDSVLFNPEGIEFYGKINFLKAGLISADFITTVSNNYAREILSKEYGFGLDGVLRRRSAFLKGIINGIDYREWNPESDRLIPQNYNVRSINGKRKCKPQLLKDCGIKVSGDVPVVGLVGRLSTQKGSDLFLESLEGILSLGVVLIVLGKGDEVFHVRLREASEKYKDRLHVRIGFEDDLAHRIYAGSDIFLMPSRYEPCGLGQLIAMRYGTIPVARRTGGIGDTVLDHEPLRGSGTGFLFSDYTPSALQECMKRALSVYVDKAKWHRLIHSAMSMDFSWRSSAKRYLELYEMVIKAKRQ